jgi:hypothetical protein
MASKKKERPLKGNGSDGQDYAAFVAGLLDGSIRATKLIDTTVPDGTQQISVPQVDANGDPLPDIVLTLPKRRLTKLEYDDPQGDDP